MLYIPIALALIWMCDCLLQEREEVVSPKFSIHLLDIDHAFLAKGQLSQLTHNVFIKLLESFAELRGGGGGGTLREIIIAPLYIRQIIPNNVKYLIQM